MCSKPSIVHEETESMTNDDTKADPGVVIDLLEAFRCSKTMFAAVALGIFDTLEAGPRSSSALAEERQLDPGALERLLDACVGLRLLERSAEGLYQNTPTAAEYLCRSSQSRLTGYINYSNTVLWKMWGNLEDAIREGTNRWKQTFGWDGPIFSNFFRTPDSLREFLMGMHGYGLISSPHVVAAFDLGRFDRLIDLGGATGHLAIAACQQYPDLEAAVFDLPETAPLAREILSASSVADRIQIISGDFFVDPLPEADLFAVGRILHDWTEAKVLALLERIFDRLPPGGGLLIAEKLIADDRGGPRWAHMQNLGMLLYTEGKERPLSDYRRLLERVGFASVLGCVTPSPLDAVLALKA
jgi:acetylserotonin O-methyltransferase